MPLDSLQHRLGQRVSLRSIQRWKKLYTETMSVICNPDLYENPGRGRIFSKNQVEMITDLLKSNACLFLDEIRGRVYETSGISCTNQTMSTVLKEYMGYTLKITSKIHINRSDVAREDYHIAQYPARFLVFTDESGVCLRKLMRRAGWAPRGYRARVIQQTLSPKRYNVIPAISLGGLLACHVSEENVDRAIFLEYLRTILLPSMNRFPGPNSVLVMDNAAIHKGFDVEQLCNMHGIALVYLPAYSPDLNPIEKLFGIFKTTLRRTQGLTHVQFDIPDYLEYVLAELMSAQACHACYRGSGYV
uniref:Tc1-like transposase DDE domain-containing protein n=1 Tax=Phakopsora pachyrhizi TaxID=170000 RepID=A0A0S1MIN3_PHAPC